VPVQTEATRRALVAAAAIQSTSARSDRAAKTPSPPVTISVSMVCGSVAAIERSGVTCRPRLVRNGRTSGATTVVS
jgi:hypothetical protein